MKKRRGGRVSEPVPVQVYLAGEDRARLDWLAEYLDTSKAETIRKALRDLELQLRTPGRHPIMALAGIGGRDRGGPGAPDAALEHDRVLAEWNARSS
jgi:hypothetical protein